MLSNNELIAPFSKERKAKYIKAKFKMQVGNKLTTHGKNGKQLKDKQQFVKNNIGILRLSNTSLTKTRDDPMCSGRIYNTSSKC